MEWTYVYTKCDMRLKKPLYGSAHGLHGGGTAIEHMTQDERLEAMTCQFCGRIMWGFYCIEEEP